MGLPQGSLCLVLRACLVDPPSKEYRSKSTCNILQQRRPLHHYSLLPQIGRLVSPVANHEHILWRAKNLHTSPRLYAIDLKSSLSQSSLFYLLSELGPFLHTKGTPLLTLAISLRAGIPVINKRTNVSESPSSHQKTDSKNSTLVS